MHHGVADLDACRVAVEQQAAHLFFQQGQQVNGRQQVGGLTDQRGRQLTLQTLQGAHQFRPIRHLNHHRDRAEDFFLQQGIACQQQARIGLEHLGLRLAPGLRLTRQARHARVRQQRLKTMAVAGQGAGVEHGLRRRITHPLAQAFDKSLELR